MLFRASALCLATSLISVPLAGALPTDRRSDMTLTARDDAQCPAGKSYYVCYVNNFRGCCSVDPCAMKDGCPDYNTPTNPTNPINPTYPNPTNPGTGIDPESPTGNSQCPAGKNYYVCALNNFRGCCSVDPCAMKTGCPDYKNPTGGKTKDTPTPGSSGNKLPCPSPPTNPGNGQCEAGKNYYVCALNNFRGCCSVDPCALKDGCPDYNDPIVDDCPEPPKPPKLCDSKPEDTPCEDPCDGKKDCPVIDPPKTPEVETPSKPCPSSPESPCPSDDNDDDDKEPTKKPTTPNTPSCPKDNKKTKLFQPLTKTLIPNGSPITTPNLNVSKSSTKSWQQTISWTIPSTAKNCAIGWAVPEERTFKAGSNSRVAVYDLEDKTKDAKPVATANFALWPELPEARSHIVAPLECKEKMTFRLEMIHDDMVFLEQNAETGWWVEYSC